MWPLYRGWCVITVIVAVLLNAAFATDSEALLTPSSKTELTNNDTNTLQLNDDLKHLPTVPSSENLPNTSHNQDIELLTCKAELASAVAEQNEANHSVSSIQERMDRMEEEHQSIVNETVTEIETLLKDKANLKKQLKSTEDRFQESRTKLKDLEFQLRDLQQSTATQWVNFTLIQQDIIGSIDNAVTSSVRVAEGRWDRFYRHLRPKMNGIKRKVNQLYQNARMSVIPKTKSLHRSISKHWTTSKHFRPFAEAAMKRLSTVVSDAYLPFKPFVVDAKESLYLSAVSIVEESSKGLLFYLEISRDAREKREKRRLNIERGKAKRNTNARRKDKDRHRSRKRFEIDRPSRIPRHDTSRDDDDYHFEPSDVHSKMKEIAEFSISNSEQLVNDGTAMLPLAFVLFIGNCYAIGTILLLMNVPRELIWLIGICRAVWRCWRACRGTIDRKVKEETTEAGGSV